ncbi:hypothetical protein PNK_2165 [Candidatus Protochlamydia naegleriophila]|uniref:Uncharacterized protein n=1 Tax=Candidatus Protochlamydia naegleriophila TaxID=389348 RepID=A0A0U5JIZ0_9BACT|nr:hypothetical protein [Candidatus Protochlamydia naegleriophila]CUI17766.1 hypothetical protein PNK_2165 [Candidatus Protochlamydia naegleriophila]
MLNAYGICSVNRQTFNMRHHDNVYMPRALRNVVITALRIHNGILNVLGYMPAISTVSGCVRMATGLGIIAATLTVGQRNVTEGAIIGHWYSEALMTGIAQVARGALEAVVPFGWIANAALDVVATPLNLIKQVEGSLMCDGCREGFEDHVTPHREADYPLPLKFLYLA